MTQNSRFLPELQELWYNAVVIGQLHDPQRRRPLPCWFGENVPGIDSCDGRVEGAHWIKRQRAEKYLSYLFDVPGFVLRAGRVKGLLYCGPHRENVEAILVAAWDPRNGVPACNKHHTRFDSQRMPPLVIWRHEVPPLVEAFARDWGLETALQDKCPSLTAESL